MISSLFSATEKV